MQIGSYRVPKAAEGAVAIAFYMGSSILLQIVNKIVLSVYAFPAPKLVMLGQFVVTSVVLFSLKLAGKINFPGFNSKGVRMVLPISVLFLVNILSGVMATKFINLPTMTAVRRLCIWFTLELEMIVFKKTCSTNVRRSILLMVGVGVLAAVFDLQFSVLGYGLAMVNNVATAVQQVTIAYLLSGERKKELGKNGLLFYNSLFSLAMLMPYVVFFTDDFANASTFLSSPTGSAIDFRIAFFLACTLGIVLNYAAFLAIEKTSATTQSVSGCMKNAVVAYLGILGVGGDYIFSWPNFLSVNLSIVASLWYTDLKIKEKKKAAAEAAAAKENAQADLESQTIRELNNALDNAGGKLNGGISADSNGHKPYTDDVFDGDDGVEDDDGLDTLDNTEIEKRNLL